jgi:small subunit ribosomal protein S20
VGSLDGLLAGDYNHGLLGWPFCRTGKSTAVRSKLIELGQFEMANIRSAKKRIRQTARKTMVNRTRVSRIRTFIKKVETAIASGEKSVANDALKAAQPEIQRGVSKGVLVKATASRKISRLNARIKALS